MPDAISSPEKKRVLIIDDEAQLTEVLGMHLEGYDPNFEVDTADNGERGLAMLAEKSYDLLILDHRLRGMSGIKVMENIREREMDLPIIFLTGMEDQTIANEAIMKGAWCYLGKDNNLGKVIPVIVDNAILDSRSRRQLESAYVSLQKALSSSFDLDNLCRLILSSAQTLMGADSGSLMLLDDDEKVLVMKAAAGLDKEKITLRIPIGERVAGMVAQDAKAKLIVGGLEDNPEFKDVKSRDQIGSALCVPLISVTGIVGVLSLNTSRLSGRLFDQRALDRLNRFAGDAAAAIANSRLSKKVADSQSQLVHSEKMAGIGGIAAAVAHQLNSPLAGIGSVLETVRKRLGEKDANAELLAEASSAVEFCGSTVRALLDFSRPAPPEAVPLDVNKAIEGVLHFSAHVLYVKGIKLVRRLSPGLPPVLGFSGEIQQAFLNLISNARDAMERGGTLTISTRVVTGGKKGVEIEFADSGCGMSPEQAARIFEPYVTSKAASGGTGLGLAICRDIVKKHKGTITVTSESQKGSKFVVYIPLISKGE